MDETKNTTHNIFSQLLIAGTAACLADFVTFPFDTAKVRLQLQGENVIPLNHRIKANNPTILSKTQPKNFKTITQSHAFHSKRRGFTLAAFSINSHEITTKTDKVSNIKMQYRGLFGTICTIVRQEGLRSLYNGLSAGLQRQMVFSSVRLGMYDSVKRMYQDKLDSSIDKLQIMSRVLAGLTTGAMAVVVGQPTEVVKIKFQAQKRLPGLHMNYTSTPATYQQIGREEGIRGLWKGAIPNIGRNVIVTVSEIVCYDIVKECLIIHGQMRDNIYCHFTAAVVAGFAATIAASPVDVIKTRYMNSKKGQYSGALDCAIKMAQKEGSTAFYKGFVPAFCRLVSWNICLWISYEQIKNIVYDGKTKK